MRSNANTCSLCFALQNISYCLKPLHGESKWFYSAALSLSYGTQELFLQRAGFSILFFSFSSLISMVSLILKIYQVLVKKATELLSSNQ